MNELKNIDVRKLPNGYSLKFDGMTQRGGYFYYSPESLFKGFTLHIGLGMTHILDTEKMDDLITAAINWKDNAECVKAIDRLKLDLKQTEQRFHALAIRLMVERRKRMELADGVAAMSERYKDYPDMIIKERLDKLLKGNKNLSKLTLRSLGIDADEIGGDSTEEIDDEE